MENHLWSLVVFGLPFLLGSLYLLLSSWNQSRRRRHRLPPGPTAYPMIGNLFWLWKSHGDLETIVRGLKHKYGDIITLQFGRLPTIIVSNRILAHKFLIDHNAIFASRVSSAAGVHLMRDNRFLISSSKYGPVWRLLRGNLVSGIFHPSRSNIYLEARKWAVGIALDTIKKKSDGGEEVVVVMEVFRLAMFRFLSLMCFGKKLDDNTLKEIEIAQREFVMYFGKLKLFSFFPKKMIPYLFPQRLNKIMELRSRMMEIFQPLINSRRAKKITTENCLDLEYCYMDSLVDLEFPVGCFDDGSSSRTKLNDDEIIGLCIEFLTNGIDTTSTMLQWIMANLVKHQHIQHKLFQEIKTVGAGVEEIQDEHLQQMPYLKAVVMEGLRRHPPGYFILGHAVTQDIVVDGYFIPENAAIVFFVEDIGMDDRVWKDPHDFNPERFLEEEIDLTCKREIKMMPFGAGRRICPALRLSLLYLQYFVGNLIGTFQWNQIDGEEIDLSPKKKITLDMKTPLRSRVTMHKS